MTVGELKALIADLDDEVPVMTQYVTQGWYRTTAEVRTMKWFLSKPNLGAAYFPEDKDAMGQEFTALLVASLQ